MKAMQSEKEKANHAAAAVEAAAATPNIYFKPRAISTHSLYMLFVAFFHTQEILGKAVVEASAQAAALIFRA